MIPRIRAATPSARLTPWRKPGGQPLRPGCLRESPSGDDRRRRSDRVGACPLLALPTLLVPSHPETAFISSSHVRTLIALGALDAAIELVPTAVIDSAKARENTSPSL